MRGIHTRETLGPSHGRGPGKAGIYFTKGLSYTRIAVPHNLLRSRGRVCCALRNALRVLAALSAQVSVPVIFLFLYRVP